MIDLSKFNPANREYRKNKILSISKLLLSYKFEDAVNEVNSAMEKELDSLTAKRSKLEKEESNYFEDIDRVPTLKPDITDEMMQIDYDTDLINEYLVAISEMKIIYFFKSFEITMKSLIKTAYPEINTEGFFRWKKMQKIFKSKGIVISDLQGFNEVDDLREVNNGIKHDNSLNKEIKKISEFSSANEFDYTNLESFYKRIKSKVESFSQHIGQLLIKDL